MEIGVVYDDLGTCGAGRPSGSLLSVNATPEHREGFFGGGRKVTI